MDHGALHIDTTNLTIVSGGNDTNTIVVEGSLADLNTAVGGLTYKSDFLFTGTDTLNVTINDKGNTGTGGPLEATGNTSLVVTAGTNAAPTIVVPGAKTVNEDTSIAVTGITVADADSGSADIEVKLTVAHGTLGRRQLDRRRDLHRRQRQRDDDAERQPGRDQHRARTLSYKGTQDYNGGDTVTINVNDRGNFGGGGAKNTTSSVNITVVPVNDQPTLNAASTLTAEISTPTALGLSAGDVDAALAPTNPVEVTISATHGNLFVTPTSGVTITSGANNSHTLTISGELSKVNAAIAAATYTSDNGYTGADTVDITLDDLATAAPRLRRRLQAWVVP